MSIAKNMISFLSSQVLMQTAEKSQFVDLDVNEFYMSFLRIANSASTEAFSENTVNRLIDQTVNQADFMFSDIESDMMRIASSYSGLIGNKLVTLREACLCAFATLTMRSRYGFHIGLAGHCAWSTLFRGLAACDSKVGLLIYMQMCLNDMIDESISFEKEEKPLSLDDPAVSGYLCARRWVETHMGTECASLQKLREQSVSPYEYYSAGNADWIWWRDLFI